MIKRRLVICFVALIVQAVLVLPISGQTAVVIAEQANLRGTPSSSGKIVEKVSMGTELEIYRQKGAWYLVQAADFAGWLHGDTIRLTSPLTLETIDDRPTRSDLFAPRQQQAPVRQSAPATPARSGGYIRGPRGGCYYINSSGKKTYVDRSLCN